jgi:hypothetical protein
VGGILRAILSPIISMTTAARNAQEKEYDTPEIKRQERIRGCWFQDKGIHVREIEF